MIPNHVVCANPTYTQVQSNFAKRDSLDRKKALSGRVPVRSDSYYRQSIECVSTLSSE
jgi:hypothetical protein